MAKEGTLNLFFLRETVEGEWKRLKMKINRIREMEDNVLFNDIFNTFFIIYMVPE